MSKQKVSKSYTRLTDQLPDIEEYIKQGKINVVPIPKNIKRPVVRKWNNREYSLTEPLTYTASNGKRYTQKGLKYHYGNYGILIGYGNKQNGYSIGCIDIDGYKTNEDNPDLEIKKATQEYIYQALKDLPNSIQVKTQSGGYHIYYWTKQVNESTNQTSNSLYYPKDFPIKELAGKCLNDSIEVFTNQDKKQCVLPGSMTKLKENNFKIRKYKVISKVNKFSDMDIVEDLNQTVIDTLKSKGYGYKPIPKEPKTSTRKQNRKSRSNKKSYDLKQLTPEEIQIITDTVTPIFTILEGTKHTATLMLGGYFSYHITKDSTSQIADGINKKIGHIFNSQNDFKKTLLENYTRKVNKSGLPKLCNLLQQRDSTFNIGKFTETLNSICYPDYKKRITRPLISKPYDIHKYLEANTEYNDKIYLTYIYQLKTYMIISQKDNDFYFYPLDINYDPITLYNRSGNANWEEIETQVKEILNGVKPNEMDTITNKIIKTLLRNLKDLYINNHFTTLRSYPKQLKEYIQDPVNIYNLQTFGEEETEDIRALKEEIKTHIEAITDIYNNNSLFMSDKWINTQISSLARNTSKDPFLCLKLGITPEKRYRAEAGELIVKELGLKRSLKDSKETLYFYNDNLNYFSEVTTPQLKKKLYETLGYNLTEPDIKAILNSISTEDILNRNLIVFGNIYYNTNTMEEFKPLLEVSTYNRRDYLTVNNIGVFNESNNTINLLDFDKSLKLSDILEYKKTPELENLDLPLEDYKKVYGMTLTEIVLRQITIPKNNQTDIKLFRDYLERVGSNILGKNLYKVITFYYGDGSNGKSILNLFINTIYNKLSYEITPQTLKDDFNLVNFYNKLAITIDEVTRESFRELKDKLKQMSSKFSKTEKRGMYTTDIFTLYGYPNIFIFSNELLNLKPVEDGALFIRLDYLKLPNTYVEKDQLSKYKPEDNVYPILDNIEELLLQDTEGLSWLITAGILLFNEMQKTKSNYTCKQTKEETINTYLGVDTLTKYLLTYTEFVEDLGREEFTGNAEILNGYLEYVDNIGKEVDQDGLAKEIGQKLRKIYPQLNQEGNNYKQTGTGRKLYKLKLKSFEDITREYNQVYEINEGVTDKQLTVLERNNNFNVVYRQIQQGNCTISILQKKLPSINILETVKQLNSFGLIYPTSQTILKETEEVTS